MILREKPARDFLADCAARWPRWRGYFEGLLDAPIEVSIKPYKTKRSSEQNRLYWELVGRLGDHVGLNKDEMHEEVLCAKHGYDLVDFRGSVRKRPKGRSSKLNTTEFTDLIRIVEQWCSEEGVSTEAA